MWYFLLYFFLAIWIFIDAGKRSNNKIGWPVAVFFLGPVVIPVYLALRFLKAGEVREGGTAWNVLKYFAVFWTLTIMAAGIAFIFSSAQVVTDLPDSDAAAAGAAIGTTIGLGIFFVVWFCGAISALVLGLLLKKSSVVENGPTGPLVSLSTQTQPPSKSVAPGGDPNGPGPDGVYTIK